MDELLYLVHRIPYPPNKGDKIRSFHLLTHLAQSYKVHVGAFIDDADDWQYAQALAKLAGGEVKLLPLKPRLATLKSAIGLLSGEPLSIPYYRDRRMQAWVDAMLATKPIARALVYSSSMAQYLMKYHTLNRVIDFVDIDSDKWRQYAEKKPWPMSWVYRREARTLFDYERRVTHEFAAAAFVSEAEAALFKQLAPDCASKVFGFSNGVDTDYFSPNQAFASPYPADERAIVFTGAMDYWANVDAVTWFARDIFPGIKRAHPAAHFYIAGSRPTADVQALAQESGIHVTGAVPDTRPYIAHAAVAVAPLRIARGIQNKVLEAMAMAKPTVVSEQALEGIEATPGKEILLASDAAAFAAQVSRAIDGQAPEMGAAARQRVVNDYSWAGHLRIVEQLLRGTSAMPVNANARAHAA
ncbi:MAG: TIGR03087 family PEP-CTERM/XrtA system glycosyltransferase [Hydrogenophilales bacterium]|nr:TIGR03087 family PEP-CTERM/XrtA system glycosyltransferase [Hydrogenophilales bacterium]